MTLRRDTLQLVGPGSARIQHKSSHHHAMCSLEFHSNLRLQQPPYIYTGAPNRVGSNPPAGALSTCASSLVVSARHLPVAINRIVKTTDSKALAQARQMRAYFDILPPSHYNRFFSSTISPTSILPSLPFSLP